MRIRRFILVLGVAVGLALAWCWLRQPERRDVEMVAPPLTRAKLPANTRLAGATKQKASPRIRSVLTSPSLSARFDAAHNLSRELSGDEIAILLASLADQDDSQSVPQGFALALKNEILLALRSQTQPVMDLPKVLIAIVQNQQLDVALRDYAVQHLASWYEEILISLADPESVQRKVLIVKVFNEALNETTTSISGTALISLHRLAVADHSFALNPATVGAAAMRLLNEGGAGDLVRISAVQVCAETGTTSALPVVIGLAQSQNNTPLRMSAIAAIGAMGGSSELTILEALAHDNDVRLRHAAEAARRGLEARLRPRVDSQKI